MKTKVKHNNSGEEFDASDINFIKLYGKNGYLFVTLGLKIFFVTIDYTDYHELDYNDVTDQFTII